VIEMEEMLYKVLEILDEAEYRLWSIDDNGLQSKGIDSSSINKAKTFGWIVWSGVDYKLHEKGRLVLNQLRLTQNTKRVGDLIEKMGENSTKANEQTAKINQEMLGHTKQMKWLTIAILVFTIINIFLVAIQLWAVLK